MPNATPDLAAIERRWDHEEARHAELERKFPYAFAQHYAAEWGGTVDFGIEQFRRLVIALADGVDAEPWPVLAEQGVTPDHEEWPDVVNSAAWAASDLWCEPDPEPTYPNGGAYIAGAAFGPGVTVSGGPGCYVVSREDAPPWIRDNPHLFSAA